MNAAVVVAVVAVAVVVAAAWSSAPRRTPPAPAPETFVVAATPVDPVPPAPDAAGRTVRHSGRGTDTSPVDAWSPRLATLVDPSAPPADPSVPRAAVAAPEFEVLDVARFVVARIGTLPGVTAASLLTIDSVRKTASRTDSGYELVFLVYVNRSAALKVYADVVVASGRKYVRRCAAYDSAGTGAPGPQGSRGPEFEERYARVQHLVTYDG